MNNHSLLKLTGLFPRKIVADLLGALVLQQSTTLQFITFVFPFSCLLETS